MRKVAGRKPAKQAKAVRKAARRTGAKKAPRAVKAAKRVKNAAKPARKPVLKVRRAAPAGAAKARPAPRRAAPARGGAESGLHWQSRSPQHRAAAAPGGEYVMLSFDRVTWSAEWRPKGGRVERLAFRETQAGAEAACERHRTVQRADALLSAADAGGLVGKAITGEAVAWRR
ncbi:MAG: hypothetical protein QM767_30630 [Anaeromyxobacter sp.]